MVLERTPIPMGNWAHPHQPGDMIWVKDWKKRTTPTQLDRSPSSKISNSHGCESYRYHSLDSSLPDKEGSSPCRPYLQSNHSRAYHRWKEPHPCSSHLPEAGWPMHGESLRICPPGHKCIPLSVNLTSSFWLALLQYCSQLDLLWLLPRIGT
jgi:hypothetical protein